MKIFSEEKMAPALVLFCLSHPLAPTQTAPRQPLGSQACEYLARTRGSSHPSSPASERAMPHAAVKEGPGPLRQVAGPQQEGGRPAALRVCGLLIEFVTDTPQQIFQPNQGAFQMVSLRERPVVAR